MHQPGGYLCPSLWIILGQYWRRMIWREIKVFLLENCGHVTELQNKKSMVLSGGYEDDEDHREW